MSDVDQIRNLIATHAHLRDDGQLDEWPKNFLPDAHFTAKGVDRSGREAIKEHLNNLYLSGGKGGRHFVGSSVIDLAGDSASATTDFVFVGPGEAGVFAVRALGRYHDRFEKTGEGAWRFRSRHVALAGD
jgi:ketosteroid isomerase-like protein